MSTTAVMTTHERFSRMFAHQEADRIPIIDEPWDTTLKRWRREGMPADMDWRDYFDIDHEVRISVDNSPGYTEKTLEETDEYRIYTTAWGATLKNWKHAASTPEFLDFTITDSEKWKKAKERMKPAADRIPWKQLQENYRTWRHKGFWLSATLWFGFDVTHSWASGTERILMALAQEPEWCVDMFNHYLDVNLALLDTMWDKGYAFDGVFWWDDMGYKDAQFFSLDMYREILKPVHKRAIEWAHAKGIKAHLHSCGNINPFVPELIDIGLDALNPLEVKAGMDPIALKKRFGPDLVFHGGINAVLWDNPDRIKEEMRRIVPVMKQNGGYIFSSDHSIPDSVSLEDFRGIVALAKELGRYD